MFLLSPVSNTDHAAYGTPSSVSTGLPPSEARVPQRRAVEVWPAGGAGGGGAGAGASAGAAVVSTSCAAGFACRRVAGTRCDRRAASYRAGGSGSAPEESCRFRGVVARVRAGAAAGLAGARHPACESGRAQVQVQQYRAGAASIGGGAGAAM
jgi:hypothetical protein